MTEYDGRQVENDLVKNIKRHYKMLKNRFKNVLKKTIRNSFEYETQSFWRLFVEP